MSFFVFDTRKPCFRRGLKGPKWCPRENSDKLWKGEGKRRGENGENGERKRKGGEGKNLCEGGEDGKSHLEGGRDLRGHHKERGE